MMKPLFLFVLGAFFLTFAAFQTVSASQSFNVASPDGRVQVSFYLTEKGEPRYTITFERKTILLESKLGLTRSDADFSDGFKFVKAPKIEPFRDRYELLTTKRRINDYEANRAVFQLKTRDGKQLDIIFQVSNDGLAFRYFFPDADAKIYRLSEEKTSFHFDKNARAWLQPMAQAKTGWKESQPSYEEYYEKEIPVGTPSTFQAGWVYPALFRTNGVWVLLSESGIDRNYCGTRLRHESPNGEYSVGFPDSKETMNGGAVNPESALPWASPWRIVVVGSLGTIVESSLGTDVAAKPKQTSDAALLQPGKSSWSWVRLGDNRTNYETQKQFIDYAAAMNWRYCLIDALWDKQIGYEKIKELVDYAAAKDVKILLWYNSAGAWNSTPQTPRDRMLTRESRLKEFEILKKMGVAGLKVDFFGGDGQSVIRYYQDILEDAAKYNFVMNFHGATIPRGWERTYPNLMTMEAVRGFEFVTFEQKNADEEASHAAMLPFTRNVFDPMDFTPVAIEGVNERITRRTTSGFELALSVLFTSGIQHYAETPDGMAKAPDYVRDFLKRVPSVWDEVKFIDGYPGKFAVIARRAGNRWYIAGINGESQEKKLVLDLKKLLPRGAGQIIADGDGGNLSFRQETISFQKPLSLTLKPNGGFVIVTE